MGAGGRACARSCRAPRACPPNSRGRADTAPTAAASADNGGRMAEQDHDENLNAAEAARRLGISRDWLYKNRGRLPFAVRLGRRVVFSARGLERWNRQQMNR